MTGSELLALAIAAVFLAAMLLVEHWLTRRDMRRRAERDRWQAWLGERRD